MKKIFITLLVGTVALCSPTGCVKSNIGSTVSPLNTLPLNELPDLTNFLVKASTAFVEGASAFIQVFSNSLADGNYDVNYTVSGSNSFSGKSTMTISGGKGTFATSIMPSAGPSTITVTSVTNATGSSSPTTNNTSSLFDSTGIMGANYTAADSAVTQFNTNQVTASLAGTLLSINGVMWQPNLTTITLYVNSYTGAPGVVSFNAAGSAAYGVAGSGIAIADLSSRGSMTITATSPLLTGSFFYKNQDSSTVSGTFSCPHP